LHKQSGDFIIFGDKDFIRHNLLLIDAKVTNR
jgi:hypothetical protein